MTGKVYEDPLNGTEVYSVVQTADHGFMVAGRDDQDALLIKADSNLNLVWAKIYIFPGGSRFQCIIPTGNDFLLAGYYAAPQYSTEKGLVIRVNSNGDSLWSKGVFLGNKTHFVSADQNSDGSIILCGYKNDGLDYYSALVRMNADGSLVWSNVYEGGNESHIANRIHQMPDGGFLITGNFMNSLPSSPDAMLTKTSPTGEPVWSKRFSILPNTPFTGGMDAFAVPDGIMAFFNLINALWIVKTDFNGNPIWGKYFQELHTSWMYVAFPAKFYKSTDGDFIGNIGEGVFIKADTGGNVIWAKKIDNKSQDITEASGNRLVVAGNGPQVLPHMPAFGLTATDSLGNNPSFCVSDVPFSMTPFLVDPLTLSLTKLPVGSVASIHPQVINVSMTEMTGCVPTGATEHKDPAGKIEVYPNPSFGIFSLRYKCRPGVHEMMEVDIFDYFGKKVLHFVEKASGTGVIDLHEMADGIYFLRAVTADKDMVLSKILIKKE